MSILILLHLALSALLIGVELVSLLIGLHPANRLPIGFALNAHALYPGAAPGAPRFPKHREV